MQHTLTCGDCGAYLGSVEMALELRLRCNCQATTLFNTNGTGGTAKLLSSVESHGEPWRPTEARRHEDTARLMRSNRYVDASKC